jgi:hypothetical protein
VHRLGRTYHRLKNCFGQMMELLGDVAQMEARFASFEIVLMSIQDRCTVCAGHVIVMEIILGAPDGTPR